MVLSTKMKGFSIKHVQNLSKMLLGCLKDLEDENIVHCDLKPENIVFCKYPKSHFKLIDFNMACFVGEKCFSYIQSRFYRAPEILLGLEFDTRIDVWSLGCILMEVYMGEPLLPGKNSSEMLHMIDMVIGDIPHEMLLEGQYSERYLRTSFELPKIKLDDIFKGKSNDCPEFEDFIKQLLTIDPKKRPLASQLINHPFLTKKERKSDNKEMTTKKRKHDNEEIIQENEQVMQENNKENIAPELDLKTVSKPL